MSQVDVVVVGAGNAGLVAALTAHQQGARTVVLEAASEADRGGNSRFSGGIFRFAHSGLPHIFRLLTDGARREAVRVSVDPYPAERFLEDAMRVGAGKPDLSLIRLLIDQSYPTMEWMRDQGVNWELTIGKLIDPVKLPDGQTYVLPPGGAVRSDGEGVGLTDALFAAAERAGIEVLYDSPAISLIAEGSTILGVRTRQRDRFGEVLGSVVLASGGFEANPEMRRRYLGSGWDLVKVRGTRYNMGTMLAHVLTIGGKPAGHWGGCHAAPIDLNAPDVGDLRLTDKMSRYSYPYGVLVNVHGERFVDEGSDEVWLTYAKTGAAIMAQPNGVAFQLFDQKTISLLEPRYSTGSPIEAGTIEALAKALSIEPASLCRTVTAFNEATPDGPFDPFRKDGLRSSAGIYPPKSNWAVPLDDPPFVAYPVTCGITFTYGGLAIDQEARVLDTEGRPMPGLYATGEIAGGFFFHNYPAGMGLMRGSVFGRIAGRSAAESLFR